MADTDRPIDETAMDRPVHQGEPTYDPNDLSEAARRSQWRKVQDRNVQESPRNDDGV